VRFGEGGGMLNEQPVARVPFHIIEARLIMGKFPMSGKCNNYRQRSSTCSIYGANG
jgi:hypothetical protein